MNRFIENIKCHYGKGECTHPIPKEELEDLLNDEESGVIYQIPVEDSQICMNCSLAEIASCLKSLLNRDRSSKVNETQDSLPSETK